MDDDTRDLSVEIDPDQTATVEQVLIEPPGPARWFDVTRSQVTIAVAVGLLVAGLTGGAAFERAAPAPAAYVGPDTVVSAEATPAPTALVPSLAPSEPAAPPPSEPTTAFYGVAPNDGEGMISIVARLCGLDAVGTWRANARDNDITAPNYLVRFGSSLDIDCRAEVLPPDPTELAPPPAPAPVVAAAAAPAPAPAPVSGWVAPLPGYGGGNCNYWELRTNDDGTTYNHRGEDIAVPSGVPILAAAAGTIYSAGWDNGGGNMTVIQHAGGIATVYMHQSSIAVWSGWVEAGQVIGYVGNTGHSYGPHLHFEVQPWGPWNGVVNPIQFLADRGVSWGC